MQNKSFKAFIPVLCICLVAVVCILALPFMLRDTILTAKEQTTESETIPFNNNAKNDAKAAAQSNNPHDETVILPQELFPIAENIVFSEFDFTDVASIIIIDGQTGAEIELTEYADITAAIDLIKGISGSSPMSNKGYYGFYCCVEIKKNNSESIKISFSGENSDSVFSYGLFERENGHDYSARYKMSGAETASVLDFFSKFL